MRTVFLSGLNQPFGVLIIGNFFYIANTDGSLLVADDAADKSWRVSAQAIN